MQELDIYKIEGKTQVFLLEIPSTATDFFANATSSVEEDITKKARESFTSLQFITTAVPNRKKYWTLICRPHCCRPCTG